jgi:glycosyltransferase involved in cell wall biosynthesis
VHQGAASARNRGLEEAKGRYIWFVDSDDFISSSALKTLVRVLSLKQYDILCFSTKNYSDVPQNYLICSDSKGLKDLDSHNVNDLLMMLRKGTVWSRVFNKKFIDGYRFNTKYSYSEDSQFVWRTTLNAHNVAYLNDSLYGYVNNKNSLTSVKPYERFKCYIQVVEEYLLAIDKTDIPQKDKKVLVEECEKRLYFHAFYTYEYSEMTAEMWNKWYEVYYNVMIDNKMRGVLKRMVSRLIWGIHFDRLFVQIYSLMRKGKLSHIR